MKSITEKLDALMALRESMVAELLQSAAIDCASEDFRVVDEAICYLDRYHIYRLVVSEGLGEEIQLARWLSGVTALSPEQAARMLQKVSIPAPDAVVIELEEGT